MSRLIDFYRGAGTDTEGRTIARVWAYSDRDLEEVHDFIQWLFPLAEPSRFNPDAPLPSPEEVAEFRADPVLQENLRRSLGVFLRFLGLSAEGARIVPGPNFAARSEVWRSPNHNWLRITRVLTSLRRLGLERESSAFFEALRSIREGGRTGISAETFGYWERAALGTD